MTKELIENIRAIIVPYMAHDLRRINYENMGEIDAEQFSEDMNKIADLAIKALEQEPCEAISREALLNGLANIAKAKAKSDAQKAIMGRVIFFTEHLPPVQPKQTECEDAISRKDAIKAISEMDIPEDMCTFEIISHINLTISNLPSVQPKPKTETITEFAERCRECGKQKKGHWIKITPSGIYMCSECEQNVLTGDIDAYHYCHHCGVKMINESEKS